MIKYLFLFLSIISCNKKSDSVSTDDLENNISEPKNVVRKNDTITNNSFIKDVEKDNINSKQKKIMERFNNKDIINKKEKETEFISGDTIIRQRERSDIYYEEKLVPSSNTVIKKHFDKKTLNLIYEATFFHGVGVGVRRTYDAQGKLIYEKDIDAQYPVSVADIIDIIKTKCGITFNELELDIRRFPGNNSNPKYRITHHFEDAPSRMRMIIVDGENGNILSDEILFITPD